MKKLSEIYNPLSDTYLTMEETKGWRGPRYSVYRQARSPEFLIAKEIHDGKFGLFVTRDFDRARRVFEKRLVEEADATMRSLSGYNHFETGQGRHMANLGAKFDALNVMILRQRYGSATYEYEVCDTPRRKLYAFENAYFGFPSKKRMNIKQVRALVQKVSDDFELPQCPRIFFRDYPTYETHLGERREIRASALSGLYPEVEFKRDKGMVCKRIVLHEMAHIIVDAYFPGAISHGPHFAMVATNLYDRYSKIDRERYFELANDPRYKVFGPGHYKAGDIINDSIVNEESVHSASTRHLLRLALKWRPYSPAARPRF